MTHCPARTGPRSRRVPDCAARRAPRSTTQTGDETEHRRDRQHHRDPEHPDGHDAVEAAPVHRARAALGERGTDETAEERVTRARRQARHQVMQFHTTAPVSAAPSTAITSSFGTVTMPATVSATARAEQERADDLADRGQQHRAARAGGPRGHQRGDRVRRVVDAVGEREGERHRHRHHESGTHPLIMVATTPRPATRIQPTPDQSRNGPPGRQVR